MCVYSLGFIASMSGEDQKAIEWYEKSSDKGFALAKLHLAQVLIEVR